MEPQNCDPQASTEPSNKGRGNVRKGRYWMVTIREQDWAPTESCITTPIVYVKGQLEQGAGGYRHWQVYAQSPYAVTLRAVQSHFGGSCHVELSRSKAAEVYVWKEDTRIGDQFEYGNKPVKRNSKVDWEKIVELAKAGNADSPEIPKDIFLRYYGALKTIAKDYSKPEAMERTGWVFYGDTRTGKSRKAYNDAGKDCYFKNPNTKFWDGYRGEKNIIIDEFRGRIDVSYLLMWLDRYPVRVEVKGSAVPLKGETFWITSNLHPKDWYPELDIETYDALMERFKLVHFKKLINIDKT